VQNIKYFFRNSGTTTNI